MARTHRPGTFVPGAVSPLRRRTGGGMEWRAIGHVRMGSVPSGVSADADLTSILLAGMLPLTIA